MKKKWIKRICASMMAAAMLVGALPAYEVNTAKAASTVENVNLLKDPSFEEDIEFSEHQDDQSGNWFKYTEKDGDTVKKVEGQGKDGDVAAELSATNDALEQDIPNLVKGAKYKVSVWAKNTDPSATTAYICIKWYGGSEVKLKIDSTEYKEYSAEVTYTGETGKNMRVATWIERSNGGKVYVDDWNMEVISDISKISVENGQFIVNFKDAYTGTPTAEEFEVTYSSSLDPENVEKLEIVDTDYTDHIFTMKFDSIEAMPVAQTITTNVSYIPKGQTFTLDYMVAASGEEVVEAKMESMKAENEKAEITLDAVPTVAPTKDEFTAEYKINDGEYQTLEITGFTYDKEQKTVVLTYNGLDVAAQAQEVSVKVTYKDQSMEDTFVLEIGEGTAYYVDATNGNDANDGKSPANAWKTIDKVNEKVFQPGDQILFKKGEIWTGALKPQGSGVEGAPIVIASYGDAEEKPVLKPGANWTIDHFNVANSVISYPTVNNAISFYNQEYWEVRDLELYDPSYEQNANTSVYRRGINITAEDIGDLHYFLFDNLDIHGFRGPISNEGKSSGGIIMTVITSNDVSKRVPSAVHDITVQNCNLYDLGRSGINFVSPWTTRQGDEWRKYGSFGYNGKGAWKPYENFTMRNNIFHDIDGDGTIVDGCSNALVENNIVYRAVYNCWYGVGLFNWNSDNVVLQYNEVYDSSPADSLLGAGDGQGIEIDALNKNTLVQYNYLHDNAGGVFMWCNTNTLLGFDGVYRYNISQNDGTGHGVIDWRQGHTGSMAYNNVIWMSDSGKVEKFFQNGSTNNMSDAKFYNNIFVTEGKMGDGKTEGNIQFLESEIDWKNNIFYGYKDVPDNDTNVITEDPKFVAPGTGEKGIDTVEGYKLQADSPAIDAGINIENNGGRDYFGTELTDGKADIGAAEYVKQEEVPGELSTAVLEYALELAEKADTEGVLASVVERFEAAKADAKKILDKVQAGDPSVTQKEIDDSWRTLIETMQYLSFKQGDKTDLEKVIALAAVIEGNLDAYVDEGKQEFADALALARETMEDGDAMQGDIDDSWKALLEAMANLRLKADKSALEELVNSVSALDLAAYTEESVQTFKSALASAQSLLEDETLSEDDQTRVNAAVDVLASAKAALEEKQASVGSTETIDTNTGNTNNQSANMANTQSGTSAIKSAKTGDMDQMAMIWVLMILAAGCMITVAIKKKEN